LLLAPPGSALWPYNSPYVEGEDIPWSQDRRVRAVIAAGGHKRPHCRAGAIERFRDQVVVKLLFENSPRRPGRANGTGRLTRVTRT
jgi:hypothetical protein